MSQTSKVVVLGCLGFCLAWTVGCVAVGHASSARTAFPEAVVVEAVGLNTAGFPVDAARAYREALLDARRNALLQAHAVVSSLTLVQEARLTELRTRTLSLGRILGLEVLESGFVADALLPTYRVRVKARIGPLVDENAALFQAAADPQLWRPRVVLNAGPAPAGIPGQDVVRHLKAAMEGCGLELVEPDAARPTLLAQVRVTPGPKESAGALTLVWQVAVPPDPPAGDQPPVHAASGKRAVADGSMLDAECMRVGVAVAQEAMRLWATPRLVTVSFVGIAAPRARAIGSRLPPSAEHQWAEESRFVVRLALAGDPLRAVQRLLDEAGCARAARLKAASLTSLTYSFDPSK
jgi:hypothetical protein